MSSGISLVALLGLFVLGLGVLGLAIVFLRGSRGEGAAPSPASRIGCTVFGLATIATLVFLGKGCSVDQQIVGEEHYTLYSPGTEIFLGDQFLATGSGSFELADFGGREFPEGTSVEEMVAAFFPDASEVSIQSHSTAGIGIANRLITVAPYGVDLRHPDGSFDSLVVLVRTDRGLGGRARAQLDEQRAWLVRVRAGAKKRIQVGTVAARSTGRSLFEKLMRQVRPPGFTIDLTAISGPPPSDGVERTYWIDRLPTGVAEEPMKAPK